MIEPQTVLFVQFTAEPSGSPISGLMVVDSLRKQGYTVHTVFAHDGALSEAYRERSTSVTTIPHGQWLGGGAFHRQWRKLCRDRRAVRRFERLFREHKPSLVYVNNLTGMAPAAAARRLGIPCIWHVRELFADEGGEMHPPAILGKRYVRQMLARCADHVVVVSRAVRDNVLGRGWNERPVTVLPNAVDRCFFDESRSREEARRRLDLPVDARIVGVPGTLRPVKGHDFFLKAAKVIHRFKPDVRFAITGDGPQNYREMLQDLIRRYRIAERVHFLGTVTDMPAFYRACDVVCVPSRSEPFGRTPVEAMAVGTPVVASKVGGLRETIRGGQTGLLVHFGEYNRLAQAIMLLLDREEVRRRLTANARREAEQRYTFEAYDLQICSVINKLTRT
ncbi:hypothetical protein JCM19992_17760 [Thermostilla marina]